MNVGIIAHNSKKALIEDFCIAYKNILAKHEIYATEPQEGVSKKLQIFGFTNSFREAWAEISSLRK